MVRVTRRDQVQTFLSVEIIIATEIMHCFVDFFVKLDFKNQNPLTGIF